MAGERQLPGIGLHAYWTPGSNGWNTQHDPDTRKASVLIQLAVEDIVTSLPGSPTQGDIYITTEVGHENQVAAYDEAAWVYYTPGEGWVAFEKSSGLHYTFNGTNWVALIPGSELPSYGAGDELMLLRVNADASGLEWFAITNDLPPFGAGDAFKKLRVNAAGDGVEWAPDTAGLPAVSSGDALKVLRVNSTEDGYEWFAITSEFPAYTAPDALKVLRINATGDALEWALAASGLPSYGAEDAGKVLKIATAGDGVEWADDLAGSGGSGPADLVIVTRTTSLNLSGEAPHAYIVMENEWAATITVPTDTAAAFAVGTSFTVFRRSAGTLSVAAEIGVTLVYPDTLNFRKIGSAATLVKIAANVWTITGDMAVY